MIASLPKPPHTSRRPLPAGIYKDGQAYRAVVAIAAGRKEKRFPPGTPLRDITRWRHAMRVKLETLHPGKRAGAIGRHTFSADVKKYLSTLTIASWVSRRAELRAWERHVGTMRRSRVISDHVQKAIKAWTDAGVSPKTIINRCLALSAFYKALDGREAWTPLVGVQRPKVRPRKPIYVPVETILDVEHNLRKGNAKTRARFMVLTATGARPVHLKRAVPQDVDLERRYWNIPSAKGGEPIEIWLNDDMVVAWKAFIAADAWGNFCSGTHAKRLRAAGWPEGVKPYNAKHTFGQDLADRGMSRETIADWYGHTDAKTTKVYTGTTKLRRVSEAMDGRLGWGARDNVAAQQLASRDRLAVDLGRMDEATRKLLLRQLLLDQLNH